MEAGQPRWPEQGREMWSPVEMWSLATAVGELV